MSHGETYRAGQARSHLRLVTPKSIPAIPAGAYEWDARTELAIAVAIERHLAECPPPEGARFGTDFERWAAALRRDGERRLAQLGKRPLAMAAGHAR